MMKRQELIRLMTEKAQSVQTIVTNIRSLDEAFEYSAELTQQQGGETLACLGFADMANLRQACDMQNLRLLDTPMRNHLNQIHTSLTLADWGIAETGTLVADSTSEYMRIATMLAENHVAVIPD
jgi:L-lactate dehydrogenase complex protein LldG